MIPNNQIASTEQRYEERQEERQQTDALLSAGAVIEANGVEAVQRRLEHLGADPTTAESVVEKVAAAPAAEVSEKVQEIISETTPPAAVAPIAASEVNTESPATFFERILGTSELMDARFLEEGATAARSVGRIVIGDVSGLVAGFGTGVLIAPTLVMTNNHVLNSAAVAALSTIELDYEAIDGDRLKEAVSFRLTPDVFFVTDAHLDYTVVAVAPTSDNGARLDAYGWVRLNPNLGKVIKGERVNIIQHPNGDPKRVALRKNEVSDMLDDFLHYRTDTAPGSSGSPVFNDEWEIVALHHSGVPRRDEQNRILAIGGGLWDQSMGEHRLDWIANEGARVSRLVANLTSQTLTDAQRALLDAAISPTGRPQETRKPDRLPSPVANTLVHRSDEGGDRPDPQGEQVATITVPLEITVRIGTQSVPTPQGVSGVQAVAFSGNGIPSSHGGDSGTGSGDKSTSAPDRDRALAAIHAARQRPYFDAEADAAARADWYQSLDPDGRGPDWVDELRSLVTEKHTNQPRYSATLRHEFLYAWVDLRDDMSLHSIYSDRAFPPEQLVDEDLKIDALRASRLNQILSDEAAASDPNHLRRSLEALERDLPFNCEHVVPQSWFDEDEPMRGDLHHLFACESRCNSFRSNTPYFDFADFEETIRDECGKSEEVVNGGRRGRGFEPFHGKGPVARATLYFLLRYPGAADAYGTDGIDTLLRWHATDTVTIYDRHRNASIAEIQGNRNPFVDFPEWAERIILSKRMTA